MGDAIISRRGSSGSTINFNNTVPYAKSDGRAINIAKSAPMVAAANNRIIVAGGDTINHSASDTAVFSYYPNSDPISLPPLTYTRYCGACALAGDVAIFAGGEGIYSYGSTDAYNTRTLEKAFTGNLSYGRANLAGTSLGDRAIFAGGTKSGGYLYARIDAITSTGEVDYSKNLTQSRSHLVAGTLRNLAFVAGGKKGTQNVWCDTVDIIDTSLNVTATDPLSSARANVGTATLGDSYILFCGGDAGSVLSDKIDVYNSSGSRVKTITLPTPTTNMFGLSFPNFVIVGGGRIPLAEGGTIPTDQAYIIDSSLTIVGTITLNTAKYLCGTATMNGKGFIFGGTNDTVCFDSVEIIELVQNLPLFPGMQYKLGDMGAEETVATTKIYQVTKGLSGYIKVSNINI